MEPYASRGGDSSITRYEIGDHYIIVEYQDGAAYKYTESSAGPSSIARMKALARRGGGANK